MICASGRPNNCMPRRARRSADLADVDLEERIVDEFLRRVKALDEEKSIQIRKAISGGGNQVTIQSAFGISAPRQAQIEEVLKKQITNGFTIRYLQAAGYCVGH